jgi:phage/plasmid-like protein (TIGR03299 family)
MTTTTTATRNPAWYKLGQTVDGDGGMTASDAMKAGRLGGWNVRKEAMTTASGIVVPNRVATVRTDPDTGETKYLGYVGHSYVIQQNEETFDFLDSIVDQSGAHYDTAGFMKDGARVFMTMKMPEGIKIAGEDAHDLYLLATNGHDGFNAFKIAVVPIRLMCTNQISMAFRNARQTWTVRHTVNMAGRLTEARHSLELTFDYMDEFSAQMERLLDQAYTDAEFDKLTKALIPDPKTDAGLLRVKERRDDLWHLFTEAETNAFGRGTAYAAFNAATEYADWFAPVRGDKDGTKRAQRIMDGGVTQDFKNFALASISA